MKQKFNENTLYSKYIQALLSDTYLPICNTVRLGDKIVENSVYATKFSIIKCTKTGIYDNTVSREEMAEWTKVSDYYFGRYYPKYTERFVPTANYYDKKTHEWLGKFLRCYRDMYDIDLMPFYNCFSDTYLPNIYIGENYITSYVDASKKTIKIPIKFNQKYTIALDCSSLIKLGPVFLANDNFLVLKGKSKEDEDIDITNNFLAEKNLIQYYPNALFRLPITYEITCTNPEYYKYERSLYLLILVPFVNLSSVVVLEGDYRHSFSPDVNINVEYIDYDDVRERNLDSVMLTDLSLLQFNNKYKYPFSNRLIEYLLNNVITSQDTVEGNVADILYVLPGKNRNKYVEGVWNQYTRQKIFGIVNTNPKITRLDLNGFVDRDTEDLFNK